ncbi:class I SAM-dependent methyltransferase [Lysobacter sp. BMK333-48F3]|uniref:class I SAM-dependent methyltransferase n=1 Tax=Lysobacter sp. BMK333-48F3 TaxID=2867962 RepID=UPI001C8CF1DB|nr:methyltransferase domain-containing protein [Lysobacter sp. BMK333-48F3]MBX9400132.1 class I SAM-dependent methyltransferase [Lysobacter sp. BMK333-48F3]
MEIHLVDIFAESDMYTWERHLGQTASGDQFEASYRGQARFELTGLFSRDRKLLLDIGCASGATSAYLKHLIPGLQAWGVEPEAEAAALAAGQLDRVFAKRLDEIDLAAEGLAYGSVDAVLLADVLEHMYDPWRALVQIKPFLAPDAEVVISIPNVRNLGLLSDLADGRFDYQKWGLLDITHIRFFTLDGTVRMLQETGYGVRHVQANVDPPLSGVLNAGVPEDKALRFDRIRIDGVTPRELTEFCALQFFIKATPVNLELVGYGVPVASVAEQTEHESSADADEAGAAAVAEAAAAVEAAAESESSTESEPSEQEPALAATDTAAETAAGVSADGEAADSRGTS